MAEIRQELLDELLADYEGREDLTGPDGLLKELFARLIETAAGAELADASRLRQGRPGGAWVGQQPQRHDVQDVVDRVRGGPRRDPPGPQLDASSR